MVVVETGALVWRNAFTSVTNLRTVKQPSNKLQVANPRNFKPLMNCHCMITKDKYKKYYQQLTDCKWLVFQKRKIKTTIRHHVNTRRPQKDSLVSETLIVIVITLDLLKNTYVPCQEGTHSQKCSPGSHTPGLCSGMFLHILCPHHSHSYTLTAAVELDRRGTAALHQTHKYS